MTDRVRTLHCGTFAQQTKEGNNTFPFCFFFWHICSSQQYKKVSVLPWRCNNGFPVYCIQTTKYFVLLLTIVGIKYYECVSVLCLSYLACKTHPFCAMYCQLRIARLYQSPTLSQTNGTIFRKRWLNIKCAFHFSLQLMSENFFMLRRIQRGFSINLHRSSCKVPVFLVRF